MGLMLKYMDYGEYTLPERELGARLLKRGMSGSDVRELQELLMQLGYDLPRYGADGDYGDETVSAVTAFQRQAGLTADGVYGAQTHAAVDGCKPMLRTSRTSMMRSRRRRCEIRAHAADIGRGPLECTQRAGH